MSVDVVAVARERVLLGLARAFDDVWSDLSPAERHVVRRLATDAAGPYSAPGPNHAQVKRAIDRLLDLGLVERRGPGRYPFVEPLLAEHVRRLAGESGYRV